MGAILRAVGMRVAEFRVATRQQRVIAMMMREVQEDLSPEVIDQMVDGYLNGDEIVLKMFNRYGVGYKTSYEIFVEPRPDNTAEELITL